MFQKSKVIIPLLVIPVLFGFSFISLPSPRDIVEDIYNKAPSIPGAFLRLGAEAIQRVYIDPITKGLPAQFGTKLLKAFLPDRFDRMLDDAIKGLDVRTVVGAWTNKGESQDVMDMVKTLARDQIIYSESGYFSDNSTYVKQDLLFKVEEPGDVQFKISGLLKKRVMTDVYFPLFQINPIEVKITNKAGELIYNTGVLSTDDKGDISFNKMFTANILARFGTEYQMSFGRPVRRFGEDSAVVTSVAMIPRNLPRYRITIKTSNEEKSGTDSRVWISIMGTKNDLIDYRLDNDEDNFEKGKTDVFEVKAQDFGSIVDIQIHSDDTDENSWWKLESVKIEKLDAQNRPYGAMLFPANTWIGGKHALYHSRLQRLAGRTSMYNVCVKTGDVSRAGTDSDISVRLWSESGLVYGPILLDSSKDDFERNSFTCYNLHIPHIGNINRVDFISDCANDELDPTTHHWYVERVYVEHPRMPNQKMMGREFVFEQWVGLFNNGFASRPPFNTYYKD